MNSITDYSNKNILAPMVRCGTLAFRLLALEYGADLVYTEEIIDYKMINVKRIQNDLFNTIDYYVTGTKKPVFQTCEKEKGKVIFQLGTCDPKRALEVCKIIENDVAGIDLNMGCPKEFSVQGGMGAALLKKPDLVKEILTTMVNGCSKPITCKIRCLSTLEETINLCKLIEKCGVKAIAIHGRFVHERPREPNHNDFIRAIAKELTIPVIANGGSNEVKTYEDIDKFRQDCGVTSVMLGRRAMWNASIFSKNGKANLDDAIKRFLQISLETNNFFFSTKYVVQQMLHEELTSERGIAVLASVADEQIYELFGMLDDYNRKLDKIANNVDKTIQIKRKSESDNDEDDPNKKVKTDKQIVCTHAKYSKKDFPDGHTTPKSILHTYTLENGLAKPIYVTEEKKPERVFKSTVEVGNVLYTTPYWETSKQFTEQSAAIVCLEILGIDYKNYSKKSQK